MKAIDGIIISCVVLALLIGAAFIYPGTEQELTLMKESGFSGMMKRVLAFALPGLIMLFGIRFFIYQLLGDPDERPSTTKLFTSSLVISFISALAGTLYFFFS
ncbi:MAG: hypothetical protein KJO25_04180 [Bacteroidia bacterium]|nr:hypothetical protein [Bacteroidia bacterium]